MTIEAAANWAQVIALPLTAVVVIIAVLALRRVQNQLAEMIGAQRAETGPLLHLSFREEPNTGSAMILKHGEVPIRFMPPRSNCVDDWIAGNYRDSEGNPIPPDRAVKCSVKNVQTNATGVARRIVIEVLGFWALYNGDDKVAAKMIHLHSTPFTLAPNEEREITVIEIGQVSYYSLSVRKLSYSDLWGHNGHAFIGEYGMHHLHESVPPISWPGTWPDTAKGELFKPEWQLKRWLARESLLLLADRWRRTAMGRFISSVHSRFIQRA